MNRQPIPPFMPAETPSADVFFDSLVEADERIAEQRATAEALIGCQAAKEALAHAAKVDIKTGLGSELLLQETYTKLQQSLQPDSRRSQTPRGKTYLAALDLDNFSGVNNSYGHAEGDHALRKVGDVIKDTIRDRDLGVRLHGDELVVMLIGITEKRALEVIEQIREGVQATDGTASDVTASIGIVPVHYELSLSENLKRADMASLEAKQNGKNQAVYHGEPGTIEHATSA